jgi:hypothetical protein
MNEGYSFKHTENKTKLMRPSSTCSRLLFPVIASAGAVGLAFFILLVLRREGVAAPGGNRI